MKINIDAKILLNVIPFASTDETSLNLNAICFEKGYAVATNGHLAIFHKCPLDTVEKMIMPLPDKVTLKTVIRGLNGFLKQKYTEKTVLYDTVTLELTIDNITYKLPNNGYPNFAVFPDYVKCIPNFNKLIPSHGLTFNTEYLNLFGKLHEKNATTFFTTGENANDVIVIAAQDLTWFGLLMPMRSISTPADTLNKLSEMIRELKPLKLETTHENHNL